MQIPPTSALLRALSSLPAAAGAPPRATTPVAPPKAADSVIRASGAMAAAQKALSARANALSTLPPPGAAPERNLPRGSIINILV